MRASEQITEHTAEYNGIREQNGCTYCTAAGKKNRMKEYSVQSQKVRVVIYTNCTV
jgi:hypothetical protein